MNGPRKRAKDWNIVNNITANANLLPFDVEAFFAIMLFCMLIDGIMIAYANVINPTAI